MLLTCEICGQENLTEIEMKQHMQHEHIEDTACPFCNLLGLAEDELWWHINVSHNDYNDPVQLAETDCRKQASYSANNFRCKEDDAELNQAKKSISNKVLGLEYASSMNNNLCSMLKTCSNAKKSSQEKTNSSNDYGHSKSVEQINRNCDASLNTSLSDNVSYHFFDCCLCPQRFPNSHSLSEHLNIFHQDILSPQKAASSRAQFAASTASVSEYSSTLICPVCFQKFLSTETDLLTIHVNEHFSKYFVYV